MAGDGRCGAGTAGPLSDKGFDADIVVIGAGVVGCAVARELAGTRLSVVVFDARDDIGDVTSKANTAILHTGFDAKPGTLESRMVHEGYFMLRDYAAQTGIAVEHTGAVLVAWNDEQLEALPGLRDKAVDNRYTGCALLKPEEVYSLVPHLGPGVLGGLHVPDESIIDPWSVSLAFMTEALSRGARLRLGTFVSGMAREASSWMLHTSSGQVRCRWVVNAAGLGADVLDRMVGFDRFTVTPRRGELIVFDKLARPLAPLIVLPVPTKAGKGVLVSPTIFGNVMLGPTSEDLTDRTQTATSEAGLAGLREKGRVIMPALLDEEVTTTYAGLRAATEHSDYVVDVSAELGYALLGGIRSTGLTASMALAAHLRTLLSDAGVQVALRPSLPDPPRVPNLGNVAPRSFDSATAIAADPTAGEIICFCERVTRHDLDQALSSAVPPGHLDGLRRRTRAMMGRCQGFYCGANVEAIFKEVRP